MSVSSELFRDVGLVGGSAIGLSVLPRAVSACIMGVPEQHSAFREYSHRPVRSNGQFYGVVGTGNYFRFGLRNYRIVSEQSVFTNLQDINVNLGEEQITVSSIAEWGVLTNPKTGKMENEGGYRFAYNVADETSLVAGVLGICGSALRNVVLNRCKGNKFGTGIDNPREATDDEVYPLLSRECSEELFDKFGAELRSISILQSPDDIVSPLKMLAGKVAGSKVLAVTYGNGNGHHNGNGIESVLDVASLELVGS